MTTRRELAALQRKVNRAIPPAMREVRIFIKETAVKKDAPCNSPLDTYYNQAGEQLTLHNNRELEKQGIECICVIPVTEIPLHMDLSGLSNEELETLENILIKAEGRDVSAAAAVKAVI